MLLTEQLYEHETIASQSVCQNDERIFIYHFKHVIMNWM